MIEVVLIEVGLLVVNVYQFFGEDPQIIRMREALRAISSFIQENIGGPVRGDSVALSDEVRARPVHQEGRPASYSYKVCSSLKACAIVMLVVTGTERGHRGHGQRGRRGRGTDRRGGQAQRPSRNGHAPWQPGTQEGGAQPAGRWVCRWVALLLPPAAQPVVLCPLLAVVLPTSLDSACLTCSLTCVRVYSLAVTRVRPSPPAESTPCPGCSGRSRRRSTS